MTTQQEIDGLTWHNAINKLKVILKKLTVEISSITGYIPLSGTTVGNPLTGDIKIDINGYTSKLGYNSINDGISLFSSNYDGSVDSYGFIWDINSPLFKTVGIDYDNGFMSNTDFSLTMNSNLAYTQKIYVDRKVSKVSPTFTSVPIYADNTAAIAGSLIVGDVYRTSTGVLMIRF